jgi:tRNA pseudouridine38-40 synthase
MNQKAHFDLDIKITPDRLIRGMNSLLPDDIYIKKIESVADDFHARFNAIGKEYIYKIL